MNVRDMRHNVLTPEELDQDNQLFFDLVEKIGERLRECENIGLQIFVVAHTPRDRPLSQKFQINVGHNSYPSLFIDVSNNLREGPVVRISQPAEDYYDTPDFADYTIDTSDLEIHGLEASRAFSTSPAFIEAAEHTVSENTPQEIERYARNIAEFVMSEAEVVRERTATPAPMRA